MGVIRTRPFRDAVLVLVGATCMHLASSFFNVFQLDIFSGDIIVNTQVNQPPIANHVSSERQPGIPKVDLTTSFYHSSPVDYDFPETTIDAHAPGWTVFRNLYMSNGTLYVVTPRPASDFPDIRYITSTGLPAENTPENIGLRMPTKENLDFITPAEAREWWGPLPQQTSQRNRVWNVQGNTFLFNDPSQFLDHYYHFCGELLLGAWSFWQGAHNAEVKPQSAELTSAPPVHRAIFTHAEANGWRDRPGFNSYFFRAAFPSLTVEVQKDWEDRVASTAAHGEHARAWHFDSVLLTDRSAAFRGVVCGTQVHRTAGEAFHHMRNIGNLTKWWWEPIRRAVLRFAQVDESVMEIGTRTEERVDKSEGAWKPDPEEVVITYINRQGVRRHLIDQDHDRLVAELEALCVRKGWELNNVQAEKLTKEQQLELVARTTVLIGVHGNGLTHLIMMSPTPISTVIEIFFPGGFAHDYEWTARALGHKHFAIWNDTYHTHPNLPWVEYVEGFQGTQIPVYAPNVVKIIEDRVEGRLH